MTLMYVNSPRLRRGDVPIVTYEQLACASHHSGTRLVGRVAGSPVAAYG